MLLLKSILRTLKKYIYIFLYYIFRTFPIQEKKIFLQNFNGKGYGDSPKYIAEEIIKRKLDYKLVWAVNSKSSSDFPHKIKKISYKSIRSIFHEVTSKIWIDNCRKQIYVRKRKNQYYIQTWHGGPNVLKKIEKDVESTLNPYYISQAKHDSSLIDLFLSSEKNKKNYYESAMWYSNEVFDCGSPADDIFFLNCENIKEKIYSHYSLNKTTKIIFYAPTFRNTFNTENYNLDFSSILDFLRKKTNEKWVFFVRLHPNISDKENIITYNNSIINTTKYNDVQELLFSSDILISDYSGVILEFSMMKKPVFLYANDYDAYINERDFYYDLFSLPYPVAKTNSELLDNISNFDNDKYQKSLDAFFKKINLADDGNASRKVVDRIIQVK